MSFTPDSLLSRTVEGTLLLQNTESDLSRTERLLLIMINGSSTVGEISSRLYSIPLRRFTEALDTLSERGLIREANDVTVIQTQQGLKRQQLEAFLRPAELDPTTAMIANFEIQAALNEAPAATVMVPLTTHVKPKVDDISQRIHAHLDKKRSEPKSQLPKSEVKHNKVNTLQTAILTPENTKSSKPIPKVKQTQKVKTTHKASIVNKGLLWVVVIAIVWFGSVWVLRHT